MSVEFPTGVKFVGVDVAPSVLYRPADNISFEIYNFPRQGQFIPPSWVAVRGRRPRFNTPR